MTSKSFDRASPRTLVLLLLGLATLVKVLWAMNSVGTCDVMLFIIFAKALNAATMAAVYQASTIFNHTPFTGWMVKQLWIAANGDEMRFAFILRALSIVADIALVLGLLHVRKLTGKPPAWALCLFAVSPVSIMVSGFHGNFDPVMVMFLFFAAVAVLKDQPILCGLLFALACNIKIVPILVAPVFIFYWMGRGWRPAVSFMATAGAIMLAGAAYGFIYCPAAFLRNVFGYGGYFGTWGFTYWLRETGFKNFQIMDFDGLSVAQTRVMLALKLIMMAGMLTFAWRRRKLGGIEFFTTLTAAFTWIFVFASGVGPQYMVWFAPFILVAEPRWWAALTTGSTIFMARLYHSTAAFHFPWVFSFPKGPDTPYWAPWTNLAWGTFILLLCFRASAWLGKSESRIPNPEPFEIPILPPAIAATPD